MRELREFRAHYSAFRDAGVAVAGVSLDPVEEQQRWAERFKLPYPLLSDEARVAGREFGILRRIGIGGWNVEFLRRSTLLADARGMIVAQWSKVKIRGHAAEVLQVARVLVRSGEAGDSRRSGIPG